MNIQLPISLPLRWKRVARASENVESPVQHQDSVQFYADF